MHPVGPHSAQTYWVRRVVVAAVAVVVVIGGVWWALGRGSGSTPDNTAATTGSTTTAKLTGVLAASTDATDLDALTSDPLLNGLSSTSGSTTTATTASTTPSTTGSSTGTTTAATAGAAASGPKVTGATTTATGTAKPTTSRAATTRTTAAVVTVTVTKPAAPKTTAPQTTAPPKPSYDSAGRLICQASSVSLTGTIWGAVSGQQPRLAMNAVNTGKQPCQFNVTGAAPVYTVTTAAGAHVWSTADCFPSDPYPVTTLRPGQKVSEVIVWSGKTSAPGCSSPRVTVKAGTYALVIQLGAFKSAPLRFTMK